MPLIGIGSICTSMISISDVYKIPKLTLNLASVRQLCDSGFLVSFSHPGCYVQDPHFEKLIGTSRRQDGLYILDDLRVHDVAASSIDLSSFRLSLSSSNFYL